MSEVPLHGLIERAKILLKQPWRVLEPRDVKFSQLQQYSINAFGFEIRHPHTGKPITAKVVGVEAIAVVDGLGPWYGTVRFDVQLLDKAGQEVECFMEPDRSRPFESYDDFEEKHGERQMKVNFSEDLLQAMVEENMSTRKRTANANAFLEHMWGPPKKK